MTPLILLALLAFVSPIRAQNNTNGTTVTPASVEQAFTSAQIVPDGKSLRRILS